MKPVSVSAPSPLYYLLSISYILCYILAGIVTALYLIKYQDLLIGVFCIPFILFRLFSAIFALAFSGHSTGWCYRCTLYFSLAVCVVQSVFLVIAFFLQAIEVNLGNWPVPLLAAVEGIWCLYVLGSPLEKTRVTQPYMLVPTQVLVRYQ